MKIVRATMRHLSPLTPLFDAYRQFYGQTSDRSGAARFLKKRLQRKESVIFLAIDESRSALGFAQLYPTFSSVSMKRLWILNDLFVAPPSRGQGVGEALIKRAVEMAKETKSVGLVLETAIDNDPAKRLYLRSGWAKEEEFERFFLNVV